MKMAQAPAPGVAEVRQPFSVNPKVVLAVSLAFFALLCVLFRRYTVDDAFISLRYARNLAQGYGLAFSTDGSEKVEGYTNFLWVLIEAGLFKLGIRDGMLPTIKILGTFLGLLSLVFLYRTARLIFDSDQHGAAAVFLVSVTPFFAFWSVGGLETPLYLCLIMLGLYNSLNIEHWRNALWALCAFVLLALCRPEGAFLVAGTAILEMLFLLSDGGRDYARVKRWLFLLAVFTVLYGGYFVWRWHYFGYLLPNTFYARAGKYGLRYIVRRAVDSGGFFLLILPFVGALIQSYRSSLLKDHRLRLPLIFAFLLLCLAALPRREWMLGYRYELPFGIVLAIFFAGPFVDFLRRQTFLINAVTVASLCLFLLYPGSTIYRDGMKEIAGLQRAHMALGRWLRDATPKGITVAGWDQGAIPYFSEKDRILETNSEGLLSNYLSHHPFTTAYTLQQRPEILLVGANSLDVPEPPRSGQENLESFYQDPVFQHDYCFLASFAFESNYYIRVYKRCDFFISDLALLKLRELAKNSQDLVDQY